ncbi:MULTISPECIES: glycosyltransferase family 2 protein [unclassified Bacteroides]|jgi:glycosyltransferase involved in cell wall biosynthesis|uniref:glycosyltransferase family 2 protein n=1 Tax=unclassified Bacteroides TaxID=2646097 RepID=UPI000E7FE3B7|nr:MULTISPECIES: glycosyltransferase family 2 protein [unclassified Bacteroides]MCS2337299.1 glycosyltransferase [Bacteroides sp. BFG-606]RGN52805.1 glycosyltransferase family 2 protein [Bacteroides sp. OM05-10AA]RGQ57656.1 glycosyltransferase family 2 protein [Bacteroides sp. AF27-33]
MDKSGLISVIIPVYNAEGYLYDCIDSVLRQTYKNIEIILVDDGSTDKSPVIAKRFVEIDKRVHYVYKENGGVSSSRNFGISIARGAYLAFVDADDTIKPVMLERMYSLLVKYDCDMCICSRQVVSDWYEDKWIDKAISIFENGIIDFSKLSNLYDVNVSWNKLYKRNLFDDIKFPEAICFGEDLYIMPSLFDRCSKIVYTSERLYNYSLRNNNSSFRLNIDDNYIVGDLEAHLHLYQYCIEKKIDISLLIPALLNVFLQCYCYGSKNVKNKYLLVFKSIYKKDYRVYRDKKCKFFYISPMLYRFVSIIKNRIYDICSKFC